MTGHDHTPDAYVDKPGDTELDEASPESIGAADVADGEGPSEPDSA